MLSQTANIHILLTSLSAYGFATYRATMFCTASKLLPFNGTFVVAIMLAVSTQAKSEETAALNLDSRLSVTWQGQELGAVLNRLATTKGATIWLDRRVDPQQLVNARHSDATLREVLDQVATEHSLGWCLFSGMIYVGPSESANGLATLGALARQSLEFAPVEYRKRWLTIEPATWPRLSEPRIILSQWFADTGIKLINPEMLSHDLWAGRSLPPLSLADRAVLLLINFEMTCEISRDGRSCRIVPIERPVLITEKHDADSRAREVLAAFRDNEKVEIQRNGRQLTVTGRWEDQQKVAEIISATKSSRPRQNLPKRMSAQQFSLKLENQPVGKVVEQVAAQLGLSVSWDKQLVAENQDWRLKLVSCEVTNGDLNQLLVSVLTPAELSYQLDGTELKILPITP